MVPDSELVVGRVAHRNNQSDYYLDGRKKQQKEVVARLLQEGIDLDNNRFLILQVGPDFETHMVGSILSVYVWLCEIHVTVVFCLSVSVPVWLCVYVRRGGR